MVPPRSPDTCRIWRPWAHIASELCPLFLLTAAVCCPWFVLMAQQQPGVQRKTRQTGAPEPFRAAQASRVEEPPKLDGTLDDPLWQKATTISNFLQREPFEGQSPTERTEVRVLYTKRAVYFGIKCFDSQSKGIVATELRRDVPQE